MFTRVKDFQREIAIVPLSAKTREGIAELLMVVTGLAQRYLESKLKIEISGAGIQGWFFPHTLQCRKWHEVNRS